MNNKIFISGKITGDPNYRAKFEQACLEVCRYQFFDRHGTEAAMRLGKFGFVPVDPCEFRFIGHPLGRYPWVVCMMVCVWHLVRCSHVYMLNDWQDSRGARIEHQVAAMMHKKNIYQKGNLEKR